MVQEWFGVLGNLHLSSSQLDTFISCLVNLCATTLKVSPVFQMPNCLLGFSLPVSLRPQAVV